MNFFADHNVPGPTVRFLRAKGHDVITAYQVGMAAKEDKDLLRWAKQQNRIFITLDRDFGLLVYIEELRTGVLYLRITKQSQMAVHQELEHVFSLYAETELMNAFIVIEPGGHRFRNLSH